MRRVLVASCVAFALVWTLQQGLAQQDSPQRGKGAADLPAPVEVTPGLIEATMTKDLQLQVTKQPMKDNAGVTFVYKLNNVTYTAAFWNRDRDLMLQVMYKNQGALGNVTLQTVNDWNVDAIFSRAYLSKDAGMVYLEAPQNFRFGGSAAEVKHLLQRFDQEAERFEKFAKNKAGGAPEKPGVEQKVAALPGTVWTGTEALEGGGKLRFAFRKDGKVLVSDVRDQPMTADFVQNQDAVEIRVEDTTYNGKIRDNTLSGKAAINSGRFKGKTWNWSVQKQAAP
jgi:hypothetical protein